MKCSLTCAAGIGAFLCTLTYGQTTLHLPSQSRGGVNSVAGRTGAVVLSASDLSDFAPQLSAGTLTIQPGRIRFGNAVCMNFSSVLSVTPTGGSGGPGTGKLYVNPTCAVVLEYPESLSLTANTNGVTLSATANPSVPADGFPIADVTISNGAITAVADRRAQQGGGGSALGYTAENVAYKDQNGGYVGRDANGNASIPGALVTGGADGSRISLKQGTCPAVAESGYDFTLCMESGRLYQLSSAGVKTPVALADPGSNGLLKRTAVNTTAVVTGNSGDCVHVDGGSGACGGASSASTLDPTVKRMEEDFCGNGMANSYAEIGKYTWYRATINGGGSTSFGPFGQDPCSVTIATAATSGNDQSLWTVAGTPALNPATAANKHFLWKVALSSNANIKAAVGLKQNAWLDCDTDGGSRCLAVGYNTVDGNTAWKFRACDLAGCTSLTSTIPVAANNTYVIELWVATAGTWYFRVNNETPQSISTHVPNDSDAYAAVGRVTTLEAAAKSMTYTKFGMEASGL